LAFGSTDPQRAFDHLVDALNLNHEVFADTGEEPDALSVSATRVAAAFPQVGQTMMFPFDCGDHWRFTVEVIGFGERGSKTRYPRGLRDVGTPTRAIRLLQ
jgi:hypothetical protein